MENKPYKGIKGGPCNTTRCEQLGASYYNKSTQKYYCTGCAEKINWPGGRADTMALYGVPLLCELDKDVKPVPDLSAIFLKMSETNSMHIILNLAEQLLNLQCDDPLHIQGEDRKALQAILDSNSLDEMHLIANERIGNSEQVAALKEWTAKKDHRTALNAKYFSMLENS